MWTALFTAGVLGAVKYLKSGDELGAILDLANATFGLIGIILGCRVIQAVVRRLVAESRG